MGIIINVDEKENMTTDTSGVHSSLSDKTFYTTGLWEKGGGGRFNRTISTVHHKNKFE